MNRDSREMIEKLMIDMHALSTEVTININDQTVTCPKADGRGTRKVTRTVYCVEYGEDGEIIGRVPKKGQGWSFVEYDRKMQIWRPTEIPRSGAKTVQKTTHDRWWVHVNRPGEARKCHYCHKNPPFWGSMCYECYKQHESEIYAEEEDRVKNEELNINHP